ncbi:MAG: TonB-dependent receptor [Bacteroidales bacterium]|nr:TonB-dependent receptor [Bacteroidales bacterium]
MNTCKRHLLSLYFMVMATISIAQSHTSISGVVFNARDLSALDGASVVNMQTGRGVATDGSGRYSIEVLQGNVRLRVRYLGFRDVDTLLEVTGRNLNLDFYLAPEPVKYEEVTVTAENTEDFVGSVRMGDVYLSRNDINSLPKLLGEADPIRFLQLTPGVQSGSEGGIGFFVRGGSVDQNLVLFDDALVYNPGHLLGFVSVFNPDIITGVSLMKSGIPARFGGRLSSVIQVNPDRGRSDSLQLRGQVGMVASRLTLNRSFASGRGSFILSGRMASINLVIKPLLFPLLEDVNPFLKQSAYDFYDMQGGLSYRIGEKDYLSLTAFYGRDRYSIERSSRIAETGMDWGNFILSGKWSHVFSDDMALKTTLSRTDYHFDLSGSQSEFIFSLLSSVEDHSLKSELDYKAGGHRFSFGYEMTRHRFIPNEIDVEAAGLVMNFLSYNNLFGFEGGIYAEDEFSLTPNMDLSLGLRYSFFNQVGPYTEYLYDETSLLQDSVTYPAGSSLAFYHHPEPRISLVYRLDGSSSVKASYMHMAQYVHLATSATVSLPMDIWLPSSREIKPQYGDQLSTGYFRNWDGDMYESSVELYFKTARNQVEFLRGVISNSLNMTMMENITIGKGRSYGAEFFLRKRQGRLTGWTGYTISRAVRKFDMINDGRIYPAKFDRRHDLSLAGVYKLDDKWDVSAVFIYVSGSAFTLPVGRYVIEGNIVNEYGDVNNYRMPPYNRLDLSVTRTVKTKRDYLSSWDFSVYNAYNRSNPFYIYFETKGNLDNYRLEVEPVMVSLFPIVPTLSYRFEF